MALQYAQFQFTFILPKSAGDFDGTVASEIAASEAEAEREEREVKEEAEDEHDDNGSALGRRSKAKTKEAIGCLYLQS